MIDARKFYINGSWVDPISKKEFSILNPASEEKIGVTTLGSKEDVNLAVLAAKEAFTSFSLTSKKDRIELLQELLKITKRP